MNDRLKCIMEDARLTSNTVAIFRTALAYDFARTAHQGQLRKDGTPYFEHVERVGLRAAALCEKYNTGIYNMAMCVGFLHDVVEDTPTTLEQIRERWGPDVAARVAVLTNDKTLPKGERNERYCHQLRSCLDITTMMVKLADMEDNAASPTDDKVWLSRWARKAQKQLEAIAYPLDDLNEYMALRDRLAMLAAPAPLSVVG